MPYPPQYFSGVDRYNQAVGNVFQGVANILNQIAHLPAVVGAETASYVSSISGALATESKYSLRRGLISTNAELAQGAHNAILERYREVHASRAHSTAYRTNPANEKNRRYAGGILESALSSPEMVEGKYDGILLINSELLDQRAKQWHRLNFGAAPQGGGYGVVTAHWGDLASASFGLDESPSPAFAIPDGFWLVGGGADEFYPASEPFESRGRRVQPQELTITRGIQPWHFLEAGLEYIGNNLGDAYTRLMNRWVDEAERRGRGPFQGLHQPRITPEQLIPSYSVTHPAS